MRTQTRSLAELPTADDFRAVHFASLKWRPAPSEDVVAQRPKIMTDAERPAPSEDVVAQPPKIMTDFVLLALTPTVIVGLIFIIALASIK